MNWIEGIYIEDYHGGKCDPSAMAAMLSSLNHSSLFALFSLFQPPVLNAVNEIHLHFIAE